MGIGMRWLLNGVGLAGYGCVVYGLWLYDLSVALSVGGMMMMFYALAVLSGRHATGGKDS